MIKQSTFSNIWKLVLAAALLMPGAVLSAQTAPDNTKVNKEDRSTAAPTADQAKNNLSDREVMAHIRRDVVKDKSLSTYAHNIKIISNQHKVTLRGPVKSDQEKQTIEQYAKKYAGDDNVTNELTVKGETK